MSGSRHYDTVAFDVRENATMLFFANTADEDITDYLLLMRTIDDDFDQSFYIEINEHQFGGHDLIREAELCGNVLTLRLRPGADVPDDLREIVLSYAETQDNLENMEAGAFRVLGEALVGGNA